MSAFLPGVPGEKVLAALRQSPGNELGSGKFDSAESSSALAANAFGWFIDRAELLPPLPGVPMGRPICVRVEAEMRFPWSGGRHPWLDAGITTASTLVGVEAKRYEPFRPQKVPDFSLAYDREWGPGLAGHSALRAELIAGRVTFRTLNAAQLIKHAYGLANQGAKQGKGTVLVYLHAEPSHWSAGKAVDPALIARHRIEVAEFADRIRGDTVVFAPLRWTDLLAQWAGDPALADHAAAVLGRFAPL